MPNVGLHEKPRHPLTIEFPSRGQTMPPKIDINGLTEAELVDLNYRIVERFAF